MIKKRLVNLLSNAKKYIYYQILWQWIGLILQIMLVYTIAAAVDKGLKGYLNTNDVIVRAIWAFVCIMLRFACDKAAVNASANASASVKRILREKIYNKLLRLGISYKQSVSTSSVVQMAVEGVDQLEIYFGKYLSQLFYSLLAPITLFIVLVNVSLKASLVLLICVPLIPISIVIVQKVAKRLLSKYWGAYTRLGDSFLENLQGLTTLKIYQADRYKAEDMDKESETFRKVTMKVLTMQLNSTSVMDIMAYGGAAVGMIVALIEYKNGVISFGNTLMILLLASEFFLPLRLLGSFFHVAMNGMSASDNIFALLDLPEPVEKTAKITTEPIDVVMRNVGYAYDRTRQVLQGINMTIHNGELVSLVGESGCGKSTIAKILTGQNKGYIGGIDIQGKELLDVSETSLERRVVLVSHENYIFKGTIKDNLLMADPKASDETLEKALKIVNLYDFAIKRDGLETKIDEEGSNLSGGQRQRLALARALLYDAGLYIFDEATSNIDLESEEMIMNVIRSLVGTKTVILISHRLENVVKSDRIYFLKNGTVIEEGSHQELMDKEGEYAKMYTYQRNLEDYSKKNNTGQEILEFKNGANKPQSKEIKLDIIEPNAKTVNATRTSNVETNDLSEEDNYAKTLETRRTATKIMFSLIKLVKPLLPIMILAITLGVAGYLCAIFLTIHGTQMLVTYRTHQPVKFIGILVVLAVLRGILHYGEQYCNHFIAFKLLAIIRHKIFDKLRKLCPAKLEGKDKGNLISIITSDTELLEVFYAHTISPIVIGVVTSAIMLCYIASYNLGAAALAFCGYILIGIVVPMYVNRKGADVGLEYRNKFGEMNSLILMALNGITETLQYLQGNKMLEEISTKSDELSETKLKLSKLEAAQKATTNLIIQFVSYGAFFAMLAGFIENNLTIDYAVIALVAVVGSFGPVVALANLANNLNQTLASGDRILDLLEENPAVEEINFDKKVKSATIEANHVYFSYDKKKEILSDVSMNIEKGKIVGIHGPSGCGKSTFLKLLMRFWDVDKGTINFGIDEIRDIDTSNLRDMESYVTQETYLFNDTIAKNIEIGKIGATREEVIKAAKKASIHQFIVSLPNGYDTQIGDISNSLSDGEKQRIGTARAFLHDGDFMLLDEPTSNLDALNEGVILKSIKEEAKEKSILIVSHRKSTIDICDKVYLRKDATSL
ncbi:ATP-binding cassette, subfamily B [Lachnospiraceae bacterium C7]|nr:ATP-binding cassette, subfamily B [Lachnospiraceae bacterium C7]